MAVTPSRTAVGNHKPLGLVRLPPKEVRPTCTPGAELTSPLYTLFPKIYLQSQPTVTNVIPHYVHQICHGIILTISKSQIYPPKAQGKKERSIDFGKDSERFLKHLGPWPHGRIK